MRSICFAGGCFWGIEEFFSRIPGVINTTVGYANGQTENPTYEQVCRHGTGHAEACQVEYDEQQVTLQQLLNQFWSVIDPTSVNRQGNDRGAQYRTGIYYSDPADLETILASREAIQAEHKRPLATEVEPLRQFFPAEEYHQDYLKKNPGGYCHIKLQ